MASSDTKLHLRTVVGFAGTVPDGLQMHPSGEYILYPLGNTVVIRSVSDPTHKEFLRGHSDKIMSIAVSSSGRFVATGQRTHVGYRADLIVWEWETRQIVFQKQLHKGLVKSLTFSADEQLLASVGGPDDNQLVVWDLSTGKPLMGATAGNEETTCVEFFNTRSDMLVTAGHYQVKTWEVDFSNKRLLPDTCSTGNLRRIINCIQLDPEDRWVYCGTSTGDVLQVQLGERRTLMYSAPRKGKFEMGVRSLCLSPSGRELLIGGGDGTVAVLDLASFSVGRKCTVMGSVTSIAAHPEGFFYCGTTQSTVYSFTLADMDPVAFSSCHYERINDICFPRDYAGVFATASVDNVRLWNTATGEELLRIQVPNLECHCCVFSVDGKAIITGWSDGKIRAFGPKSGKKLYIIENAHRITGQKRVSGDRLGVTALGVANDGVRIISGGSDNQVRVWHIGTGSQTMEATLNEHKGTVNSIKVRCDDSEFISASDDGSCIVWDMTRYIRSNILSQHTYFKDVCLLPDESQILTAGTDHKVTYWDSVDCGAIRELEASKGELFTCDISPSGEFFACGGSDSALKIFDYEAGEQQAEGLGHSGGITRARFSPDEQVVVSVGNEGGIFIWDFYL